MWWFTLAALCALLLLLQLQQLLRAVLRLLQMRIWPPLVGVLPRTQSCPLAPILQAAQPEMRVAGFVYTHTRRSRSLQFGSHNLPQYADVYYQRERDVHALVHPASCAQLGQCYEIEVLNTYIDGSSIHTFWRGSARLLLLPAGSHRVYARGRDLHNLLQAHLRRRQHVAHVRSHAADALQLARIWGERLPDVLCSEGNLRPLGKQHGGQKVYRLSLAAACKLGWQSWRARRWRTPLLPRTGWRRTRHPADSACAPELMQAAGQQRWMQLCAAGAARQPAWLRNLPLLLGSSGLLLLSAISGGSIAVAAACCVLALHLLLQYLPKAWRNGRKRVRQTSARSRFVPHLLRLLAGPAIGLLLALTLWSGIVLNWWQVDKQGFLWWLICIGLLFNLLQLLPLRPLSGGRIVDLLLPWPWLRLLLATAGALLCILLAWQGTRPILLIPALVLLLVLPDLWWQWRASQTLRRTGQRMLPGGSSSPQLAAALAALPVARIEHKQALLQALLRSARRHRVGLTASAFGWSLYGACLLMPLLLAVALLLNYPLQVMQSWQQARQSMQAQMPLSSQSRASAVPREHALHPARGANRTAAKPPGQHANPHTRPLHAQHIPPSRNLGQD